MRRNLLLILMIIGLSAASSLVTWVTLQRLANPTQDLLTPLLPTALTPKPLLTYTIPTLVTREYHPSQIHVEQVLTETETYTSFVFSYTTLGKKMTGQLNVPTTPLPGNPTIVMLRGYVPPETFQTGVGTKNAAAVLAEKGFFTVAPDFFGYGGSDPEPEDVWQARFEKPITVIELIKTLETEPLILDPSTLAEPPATFQKPQITKLGNIGLWGHSNGGQIALNVKEILSSNMPTTLWAPVTVPFPYSLLYFSDEHDDEGKAMRLWIAEFEETYDVFDFSLTQHLNRLQGELQIHHGTTDDSALKTWSDEFVDKLETENKRREAELEAAATQAASIDQSALKPIEIHYFTYPGADHNLQPSWDTVVERDVEFFTQHLGD